MSVVLIEEHDESIYDITKSQVNPKNVIYKSKLKEKTKTHREKVQHAKQHATMGRPEELPPNPKDFLKKHLGKSAYNRYPPEKHHRLCENLPHKQKVPTLEELKKEPKREKQEKNFVKVNIKNASNLKAKEPEHKMVTDVRGTVENIETDGTYPVYINLPKFGKTPKYLQRFILEEEKEYQKKKDASSQQSRPLCRYITRDEREHLLKGLKQNWEELQKEYQGLPILTDTIPKKIYKTKMENDLKQLEKDIVLIERHPYIYVYNDIEQM